MYVSKKSAARIASLISSIEANHIIVAKLKSEADVDWEQVKKWLEWRQDDYAELKALGIPVFNPETDEVQEVV